MCFGFGFAYPNFKFKFQIQILNSDFKIKIGFLNSNFKKGFYPGESKAENGLDDATMRVLGMGACVRLV